MNQRRYGIILSYFDLFLHIAIGILFLPFLLRMLGQQEYGLYSIAGSLAGYLLIMDLGISTSIVRYISKYRAANDKKSEENFLSIIFILYGIISALIIITGFMFRNFLPGIFSGSLSGSELIKLDKIFLIMILSFAFTLFSQAFTGILKACERFVYINIANTARQIIRVLTLVVFLYLGYGIIAVVLIDTLCNIAYSAVNALYIFYRLKLKLRVHYVQKTLIIDIFRYSLLIFFVVIADEIYWKLDNIILGIMTNTAVVAVYAVGLNISFYYQRFSVAFIRVFFPKIVHMVENNASGRELTDILIKTSRMQALIMWLFGSGFILFGRGFIRLWVGDAYSGAYYIAILVIIPLSVFLTQNMGIHILQAKDMHYFRCIAMLATSLLNIFLTVILVRLYGMIGAAAATSAGLIAGNIIMLNIFYHRSIGLDMFRFYRELSKGILPSLALSAGIGCLISLIEPSSWILFLLRIMIYSVIYSILIWFYGINSQEKELLLSVMRFRQ